MLSYICGKCAVSFNIFQSVFIMEKWLRTGTLKRKASDASETNSNCETSVVMDIQEGDKLNRLIKVIT